MLAENFNTPWLTVNLPFPCDIHFAFPKIFRDNHYKVLLIASEPEAIRISESELSEQWMKYDLILTHDQRHTKYPNAHLISFWDTFANEIPSTKYFGISTMISVGGGPANMSGYQVRNDLYQMRNKIINPTSFYISNRLPNWQQYGLPTLPNDKKDDMFSSMFHIAIENTIENDYFTEKILDCFNTFTVPIYRGCQNIEGHDIDEKAIIRFTTVEECIEICNNLTPLDYFSRIIHIINNRNKRTQKGDWLILMKDIILKKWADKYN